MYDRNAFPSLRRLHAPFAVVVCVVVGCSDAPVVRHPTAEFMHRPSPAAGTIALDSAPPEVPAMAGALLAGPSPSSAEVRFAAETDGTGSEDIVDAVVDGFGRVIVLDRGVGELRVFDVRGEPVQRVGRAGGAPAIMFPRALDVGSDGRLFLFYGAGQVDVFELGRDSFRFVRVLPFRADVYDGCAMDGRLYVHALRSDDPAAIHVLDPAGRLLSSFGRVYETPNRIVRHQLSQGRIACLEERGIVLLAPAHLPELRAYGAGGELLWWLELRGFRAIEVLGSPGRSGMRVPGGGYHYTAALVASPDERAVVMQVAFATRESRAQGRAWEQLNTIVIDIDGRTGWPVDSPLGMIRAWTGDVLVSIRQPPRQHMVIDAIQPLGQEREST